MSIVTKNTVVSISYKLTNDAGENIDSGDLDYLHGHHNIIPGLENELTGLTIGDSKVIRVSPADGYGEYDESLVQLVPREAFPPGQKVEVGMHFQSRTEDGIMSFVVLETREDGIVLDGNHPLAGQHLNFAVAIKHIREASAEEISHGHVHQQHH